MRITEASWETDRGRITVTFLLSIRVSLWGKRSVSVLDGICPSQSLTVEDEDEPVIGVPFYVGQNSYQAGTIPPSAILGDPTGVPIDPIQQTILRDTPAPFSCVYCGDSGVTTLYRSKPSLADVVGYMMLMMLGICFLCSSMDCLWHKYHYCPSCKEKVSNFEKSDPCAVVDPPQWNQQSFALPA